jgi:drug/metabolite transporter (DMT)-like permease
MKPFKADMLLVGVTLCWGSSYLFMKLALASMGEFNLIALRFGLAFILAGLIFYRTIRRHITLRTVGYAALLGFLLFGVFAFITFGLGTTTMSNAGFLVGLTVIFVPVLSLVWLRRKLEGRLLASVILALAGIAFLTVQSPFGVNLGDGLCILASLIYSVYILVTGWAAKAADALTLGIMQLGFTALFGLVFSLLIEKPHLPDTAAAWGAVLALGIVCSGVGFIVMPIVQQYTSPTHTGLIFALEPVFAVFFGMLFAGETLPVKGYVGAAFLLAGVLVAEVKHKQA